MASPQAKKQESKLASVLEQADAALARRRQEQHAAEEGAVTPSPMLGEEESFSNIDANPFYQIMFQEGVSPEEKKDAFVQALTFAVEDEKEANKERLAEYALFKSFLQFERKQMALEVIRLTDTGAFAELQQVLRDLNSGVIEFNELMQPLADIIDAVYELRMAGNTLDVFREIQEDKEAEADRQRRLDEKEMALGKLADRQRAIERAIAAQQEQKSLFRFLGGSELTKSARMEIARLAVDQEEIQREVAEVRRAIESVNAEASRESRFAEFAAQKDKLRELLDLTSEDHKERQKALVKSAEQFVFSTSKRVGSVLQHLDGMSAQADALYENNGHMRHAYAILSDAEKDAGSANQALREKLQVMSEDETGIQRMERERKVEAVEDFIGLLGSAAVDTTQTLKDLTEQGGSIKTMRDTNRQQVDKTTKLHSSSVSGVSERLATVLQAVSAAALNEATGGAKQSIEHMAESTRRILGQKAIENAVGMQETVDDLDRAIEQLREFGELQEKATDLTRRTLSEIGTKMGELEEVTEQAAAGLRRSIAVHADAEIHARGTADADGQSPSATHSPGAEPRQAPAARRSIRAPFKRLG
jgi:hypothetical protein